MTLLYIYIECTLSSSDLPRLSGLYFRPDHIVELNRSAARVLTP